jgi:hypothetical protein
MEIALEDVSTYTLLNLTLIECTHFHLNKLIIESKYHEIQRWYKNREKKSGYDLLLANNAMQKRWCKEPGNRKG